MTKVYPNFTAPVSEKPKLKLNASPTSTLTSTSDDNSVVVLTVWKKSLLFNCDGFTVFNAHGNLVFRVDNYSAATKAEIILMDPSGKSLLTIRRKRLSLSDNWLMYEGETAVNPILSARKHVNLLNTKSLARVSSCCSSGTGTTGSSSSSSSPSNSSKNVMIYEIEGSYTQRCCAVYDGKRRRVAEIKRKEAVGGVDFGMDVFRLIVKQPEIDSRQLTPDSCLVILCTKKKIQQQEDKNKKKNKKGRIVIHIYTYPSILANLANCDCFVREE